MAGVKGKSGRWVETDAELRARVIDKAWKAMADAFDDPSITPYQKAELAKGICSKAMPSEIKNAPGESFTIKLELPSGYQYKTESVSSGLSPL